MAVRRDVRGAAERAGRPRCKCRCSLQGKGKVQMCRWMCKEVHMHTYWWGRGVD